MWGKRNAMGVSMNVEYDCDRHLAAPLYDGGSILPSSLAKAAGHPAAAAPNSQKDEKYIMPRRTSNASSDSSIVSNELDGSLVSCL